MKISRMNEIEDVSRVLNTEKVGEGVEMPALDGVTYFIYTKDGKVVISSDPYRRDYVSYQDFCVVKEHLIEALTEKEELKLKLEARFYQLADTIGRAQLAENRIANAEVQVEELKRQVEDFEFANKVNQDEFEQTMHDMGVPKCPLHGGYCHPHVHKWMREQLDELTSLRTLVASDTEKTAKEFMVENYGLMCEFGDDDKYLTWTSVAELARQYFLPKPIDREG